MDLIVVEMNAQDLHRHHLHAMQTPVVRDLTTAAAMDIPSLTGHLQHVARADHVQPLTGVISRDGQ